MNRILGSSTLTGYLQSSGINCRARRSPVIRSYLANCATRDTCGPRRPDEHQDTRPSRAPFQVLPPAPPGPEDGQTRHLATPCSITNYAQFKYSLQELELRLSRVLRGLGGGRARREEIRSGTWLEPEKGIGTWFPAHDHKNSVVFEIDGSEVHWVIIFSVTRSRMGLCYSYGTRATGLICEASSVGKTIS